VVDVDVDVECDKISAAGIFFAQGLDIPAGVSGLAIWEKECCQE